MHAPESAKVTHSYSHATAAQQVAAVGADSLCLNKLVSVIKLPLRNGTIGLAQEPEFLWSRRHHACTSLALLAN